MRARQMPDVAEARLQHGAAHPEHEYNRHAPLSDTQLLGDDDGARTKK